MTKLDGKAALVTGGSRGIGAAIARRLAFEGAKVAFTYANSAEQAEGVVAAINEKEGSAVAIRADGSDTDALAAAVANAASEFGQLDILVNNAGVFVVKPFGEFTNEDFEHSLNVNTRAAFVAAQEAVKFMGEGGRIISIGSNLVERSSGPGLALYNLSKAALVGMTKGMARDLGPRGITANVVHPGSTNTDMNPADGDFADPQRDLMAIPQFGEPDDIAGLVAWLAGEESRFVTGSQFVIDGGAHV